MLDVGSGSLLTIVVTSQDKEAFVNRDTLSIVSSEVFPIVDVGLPSASGAILKRSYTFVGSSGLH